MHDMKILLILMLLASPFAFSDERDVHYPLTRDEALKEMLKYLNSNHPELDLSQYSLGLFTYYEKNHIWSAIFGCKNLNKSCYFGLQLIERAKPEFILYEDK